MSHIGNNLNAIYEIRNLKISLTNEMKIVLSIEKNRHHSATFPGYPFFSPPQHNSMQSQQHSQQSGQQYVATNECRLIEYRGARIAAFLSANRSQCPEYLLCLPQAFELFLKHLVGGLHTVYTKLKVSSQIITLLE